LITDITEVTRLREQVALKRNLESLGEMSAGLAHEFKNAMAALHGYAQFLQSIDHDERGKVAADALLQEVRNLSEMTTSFLNFARPQPLQLEDVSLDELIQECARELSPLFESLRVDLTIEVPSSLESPPTYTAPVSQRSSSPTVKEGAPTPLELRADTRMLRQALLNIIRNAAEAIPQQQSNRRVTIRTSIETDQAHQWVTISIQDTGAGIAPADLQKIFIPFFTTKTQGHGIGLALAHRVITEHGGSLAVVNNPAGGATFTIRLPR
jgi:signal transduction histidine kinase